MSKRIETRKLVTKATSNRKEMEKSFLLDRQAVAGLACTVTPLICLTKPKLIEI